MFHLAGYNLGFTGNVEMEMNGGLFFIGFVLFFALGAGFFAGRLANRYWVGFFLGLFLGPIGLLAAFFLPRKKETEGS